MSALGVIGALDLTGAAAISVSVGIGDVGPIIRALASRLEKCDCAPCRGLLVASRGFLLELDSYLSGMRAEGITPPQLMRYPEDSEDPPSLPSPTSR